MDVLDTLKRAKNELVTRGWARGKLISSDNTVCLLGAVGLAVNPDIMVNPSMRSNCYDLFTEDGDAHPVVEILLHHLPGDFVDYILTNLGEFSADPIWEPRWEDLLEFNDTFASGQERVLDLFDEAIADLETVIQ